MVLRRNFACYDYYCGQTPEFWEELPSMLKANITLAPLINNELHQQPNRSCAEKRPIIGVFKRVWASQLEYQQIFPGAKILNALRFVDVFALRCIGLSHF